MNKKVLKIEIGLILAIAVIAGVLICRNQSKQKVGQEVVKKDLEMKKDESVMEVDKSVSYDVSDGQLGKLIYKKGNDLILFNPFDFSKKIVLSSERLIDFDLSRDEKFIAYSLREDGFDGNSDVYLKNIETGEAIRLTEKNDMASLNPKIFPDNKKVAYVRRRFDPSAEKLSDGEIWVIDSDGDINSSKRLLGDDRKPFIKEEELSRVMDDNGNWTGGYYCIDQDEIDSVKIGISEISSDASLISYWKSSWLPECSGLWSAPQFSKADGSEFFTQKFKEQNKFVTKWKNENQEVSWRVRDIFWFENGDFVVNNGVMSTIGGESAYYYDKDQNKRWTIYDSSEQESGEYFSQMFVSDVKKVSDDKFLVAYQLYFNRWDRDYFSDGKFVGSKYYVKELAFGENLVPEKWFLSNPFSVSDMDVSIFDVKIVSENLVIYKKRTHDRSFALYLYDLVKNKEVRIDDFDGELDKY